MEQDDKQQLAALAQMVESLKASNVKLEKKINNLAIRHRKTEKKLATARSDVHRLKGNVSSIQSNIRRI